VSCLNAAVPTSILVVHSYSQEYLWTQRQHETFLHRLSEAIPDRFVCLATLGAMRDANGYVLPLLLVVILGAALVVVLRKNRQITESENRFRAFFDDSPDACLLLGDGLIVDCNRTFLTMIGGGRQQVIGSTPEAFSPGFQPGGIPSAEAAKARLAEALALGRTSFEWIHRRFDGTEFWTAISLSAITVSGRPLVLASLRNITEQVRHLAIHEARLHLMEFATAHSMDELIEETLNQAERLTGSVIGFYHFVEADQNSVKLQNWSTRTKAEFCRVPGKGMHYPISQAGVWVDCVRERKPVIHNDYASLPHRKGLPDGHARVEREMVVPVLRGDLIVALLGVGNKPSDYTQEDVRIVSQLADQTWEAVGRKRAEEGLRASEKRLEFALQAGYLGAWQLDLQSQLTYRTLLHDRIFGYETLLPKWDNEVFLSHVLPEDRPEVDRCLRKATETQSDLAFECRIRRADGRVRWIWVAGGHEFSVPGQAQRISGIVQDITDRKQVEGSLLEREMRYRMLFDHSPAGIFLEDATGRIIEVNEAYCSLTGFTREELMGHDIRMFVPASAVDKVSAHLARILAGETLNHEAENIARDGSMRLVQLRETAILLPGGDPGVLVLVVDITERKRNEAALRQRDAVLEAVGMAAARLLGANDWRQTLQQVLQELGRSADASRAYVFELHQAVDGTLLASQRFEWVAEGISPQLDNPELQSLPFRAVGFGRWLEVLETGHALTGLVQEFPQPEQDILLAQGIRSILVVPIRVADRLWGFLGFDECLHDHVWPEPAIRALETAAHVLGAAMERHRTEQSLLASEARFRDVVESIQEVFWITSVDQEQVLFVSPAYERIWGRTCQSLYQNPRSWFEAILPADRARAFDLAREKLLSGEFDAQYRITRPDGSMRWIHDRAFPVRDESGKVVRIAGVAEDVTAHRAAEEDRARLATAMEQAAEAIVITNPAGVIQYVNPAFERITGYTRQEVIGQNPRLLKSGEQDTAFYKQFWGTLLRGEVWHGRFINRKKNGQLFEEETSVSPVRDSVGQIVNYVAVKHDITKQIQLETQVRHSQKVDAIGQLAGGVAHDFNNILATMIMQADLLLEDQLPATTRDGLGYIRSAAERAASLTRQLLLFSRRQVMQVRVLDINAVVTNLTKMLQRIIGDDVRLQLHLHFAPLMTRADAGMLEQVLMNLAVNARDAMSGGGFIHIGTTELHVDEDFKRLHPDAALGHYVGFSVRDNGRGIPPEVLPRIFEPFFTTKETGKGTGLGLATVYGIVSQHAGWLNVESQPGQGARFQVFFPAWQSNSAGTTPSDEKTDLCGGTETILLVEDDPSVRLLTRAALERHGYQVVEAADGVEALKVWPTHRDQVALLLTDLVMPSGISGLVLAEKLLQDKPRLKVIYCSGYSADIAGRPLDLRPGDHFMQKPYSPNQLLVTLRHSLDG
jgi:PAS domain S-box-containing protein